MKRERVEKLTKEFADEHCYGCPFFRHDWLIGAIYCRRRLDKILCEKIDPPKDVKSVKG